MCPLAGESREARLNHLTGSNNRGIERERDALWRGRGGDLAVGLVLVAALRRHPAAPRQFAAGQVAALALLGLTLATFNRCVGRMGRRDRPRQGPTRPALSPARAV